jgi:hypothetical protein
MTDVREQRPYRGGKIDRLRAAPVDDAGDRQLR